MQRHTHMIQVNGLATFTLLISLAFLPSPPSTINSVVLRLLATPASPPSETSPLLLLLPPPLSLLDSPPLRYCLGFLAKQQPLPAFLPTSARNPTEMKLLSPWKCSEKMEPSRIGRA